MDIRFRSAAWTALQLQPSDIQSELIDQLSWLAEHQGPTFLDYRVSPFVMEPHAGYLFHDEKFWIIYALDQQGFLVVNLGDASKSPGI